jgi:type I restriction enzyme S subunit
MAKQNKPAIRFKGFTDAWEQRKLGDCFTERCESMPDGELISVTINDGIKKFSELGRHDNSNDDKSKYKKVCAGDIAYNSMRMWQGASGCSPYEGIVSPAYTVLTPNSGINSKCMAYQFKLPATIHTFKINSQGITSDNWNLKFPALSEIEIYVSPYEQEQAKIAAYFANLDHLITLHQRKYDKLQVLKKAMLEKMFPKNGSSVPEIRFKGFTDAWEQRKLEDYLTVSAEKNTDNLYTKKDVLSVSGDFGVVNQIEFQGRSFAGASVSNYGVVHTGDVVYTKSPLKANPYGIIKANKGKPGIVSVLYGVYHTRENANADFIQMYFEQDARLNNYLRPLVNKGAKNTLLISDTDALEGEVCLAPTFDEQKAIGQFFDSLDNLITLHQRELEKLQNIKKSMLEKMFV